MTHETPQARSERKATYILYATKHVNTPEVYQEASDKFEVENLPQHLIHCTPDETCEDCMKNESII